MKNKVYSSQWKGNLSLAYNAEQISTANLKQVPWTAEETSLLKNETHLNLS